MAVEPPKSPPWPRQRGESELTAFNAAADAALAHGRALDQVNDTARVLIDWAEKAMHD
jgi:hypothetical protein